MLTCEFELILSDLRHLKNLILSYQIGQESIDCQIEKVLENLIIQNPENLGNQILHDLQKIKNQEYAIGCFGITRKLTDLIKNQDRLEIYQPLAQDPKIRRIRKVAHSKRMLQAQSRARKS